MLSKAISSFSPFLVEKLQIRLKHKYELILVGVPCMQHGHTQNIETHLIQYTVFYCKFCLYVFFFKKNVYNELEKIK